jgi:hypothetical protein
MFDRNWKINVHRAAHCISNRFRHTLIQQSNYEEPKIEGGDENEEYDLEGNMERLRVRYHRHLYKL